jgi:hypothetical protein
MGAKAVLKKIKNRKPPHGVMICDVLPRKIPNMSYQGFKDKLITKMAPSTSSLGFLPIGPRFQRKNTSQKRLSRALCRTQPFQFS